MAQRTKFDPSRLMVLSERRSLEPVAYTTLEDGTPFPVRAELRGRYKNGPLLHWTIGVRDGKAVMFDMKFEADPLMDAPSGLTGSMVHDMPVGQIIESVIGRTGPATLAEIRWNEAAAEGRPHEYLTPEEAAAARRGAVGARRGRPVSDAVLQRVAEIVKNYDDYDFRKEVAEQMHISDRTASRYIKLAQERKLLD